METLRYVVLANTLLAVVSIAYYALLRRETFFGANRLALWLGLAGALLLPLLELPDWRPERVRTVMHRTAQVIVPKVLPNLVSPQPTVTITLPNKKTYKAFQDQPVRFVWSWQIGILLLYSSGVFLLLIRFGVQLVSLQQLIRKSVHESYTDFTLVHNKDVTSPFSFFNWVVLNPGQHSPDELDQILRHERVHVRQRHSFDMIGAELVCILFWFNPAAYLFRQLLHQTLEFSADRAVLAEGIDARLYQYNLIKVSMSGEQLAITNQFSGPTLRQRVSMMNSQRSGSSAWWRYGIWTLLIGMMALACRHESTKETQTLSPNTLPATTPTRAMVVELEDKGTWYRHLALFQSKLGTQMEQGAPVVLQLKGDQFILPDDYKYASALYIDGKEVPVEALQKLSPAFVSEVFVMHQWENLANIDTKAKPYQILIQTSSQAVPFNGSRKQFFTLLQAAAVSQYPLGESFSFTMNQLLEATFFHNKNALVERTKNEHLKVYDDYAKTVDIFINHLPATPADVQTVHVREVARLYTKERPYRDWFRANNPLPRFELNIQTSPKRAKRDSSYYVFSPFYSGDF
ncbi:M56 family metallopeptidase [Spirosoma sp. KCTC 42546]|uniref:M56 family metallopeptidase n=1 Tax=Spirosoma sp. KCTC 42546 TaxID=2520506 RepID=UPI00115B5E7B|nr:M56 family metallopeptidase [Spirosoma sp. KCTC 42546]QDK82897.1 M56 family metallopeptidase [Spirosoma sp. KCTC 42546]